MNKLADDLSAVPDDVHLEPIHTAVNKFSVTKKDLDLGINILVERYRRELEDLKHHLENTLTNEDEKVLILTDRRVFKFK